MKLRYLFVVNTIIALIFAAGLLLAPKTILNLYGLTVGSAVKNNATLSLVAQLLGATLIVPGLISWFAASMPDSGSRRAVAVSLLIYDIIGFGVALFVGMIPKIMSTAGWSLVVLFLLLALGYAYFLFMRTEDI